MRLLLPLLAVAAFGQAPVPAFDQYRVAEVFSGKPAAPVLKTANDRMFRSRIREGAAKGPNFAGHYAIADWGCGAGCVSLAVVDSKDGTVYRGPFETLGWAMYKYEDKYKANDDGFVPLTFRTDSRLLIARGCPNDKDCGSYFYEWTGTGFKLLRKIPGVAFAN